VTPLARITRPGLVGDRYLRPGLLVADPSGDLVLSARGTLSTSGPGVRVRWEAAPVPVAAPAVGQVSLWGRR
jgi:hypothetical protein